MKLGRIITEIGWMMTSSTCEENDRMHDGRQVVAARERLPSYVSWGVAVLWGQVRFSRVPVAFEHWNHVPLEVALEDVHEVGHEVPDHVPHGQIGKRAHVADITNHVSTLIDLGATISTLAR
jgi:hypothetical protein